MEISLDKYKKSQNIEKNDIFEINKTIVFADDEAV